MKYVASKLLAIVMAVSIALSMNGAAYAMSFDRSGGTSYSTGSGISSTWNADAGNGTVKTYVSVSKSWYDMGLSVGKSQAVVCKRFTPASTGTATITMLAVLNGELRAQSKSFWKVPGGVANADVQLTLQIDGQVSSQGVMFVGSQWGMPGYWFANKDARLFQVNKMVYAGRTIDVCAGIMSNASLVLGGGTAYSDFFSSRFSPSYISSIRINR